MKKSTFIISALLCTIFFCGCGSSKQSTPQSKPAPQSDSVTSSEESEDTDTEKTYKIGDTVKTDKWEITVKSLSSTDKISVGYGSYRPDEGDKYVMVELSAKNISKESETFLPSLVSSKDIMAVLMYEDYTFKASKLVGYNEDMLATSVNPLSEKTGIIVFDIASDVADKTSELKIVFTENNKTYTVKG